MEQCFSVRTGGKTLKNKGFSIIVSKKVCKTAVARNKNKRRIRAAVARISPSILKQLSITVRKDISLFPVEFLDTQILTALKKAGVE